MQTQDSNTGAPGAVNHPSAEEWMDFLYGELVPERRRELGVHLAQCAECAAQVKTWRAGMTALNEWTLPAMPRAPLQWQPVLKLAAAAAVVLCVGFALGRQTSVSSTEVAALKSSVAQLAGTMERERLLNASNTVAVAAESANTTAAQLLSDYAELDETRRAQDKQAFAAALHTFDLRLVRLRSELETVAVNTEDGFQQTQVGLTSLALAASDGNTSNQIP